ncbi:MAG TPA: SRPBCC family protein [Lacipirellulaceae bacterium]|jgi:carbon monoxide dehydrogenase subunit G|nr:SRPBCC family protein [Lacipirellulaceae bacterium]
MARFTMAKRVAAPIDTVFDAASDIEHAAEHIRGIEKIELLTPGPIGLGTRWRETRKMMGHEATETLEFTAFDRPRSYTIGCLSCGSYFETTFRFAPAASNATNVSVEVNCEPRSFMARLMAPLGKLMFAKMMRKCMDDDLEDIKRAVEPRAMQTGSSVAAHS